MTEKRRGWFRESVREMLVVVLSILIAFSLDAWWNARRERSEERELLTNLLREFRENEGQLDFRIENHDRLAVAADELSRQLSSAGGSRVSVSDSLLLALMITPTFDPTLGTLEEAQNSGRTGLIRNAELRARLGAWPGLWRDAREEERLAMELAQVELFPSIAGTTDLSDLMAHGGPWLARRLPERLGASRRAVVATPALLNYAKARWLRSRRARDELTNLREHLSEIIELLEGEVGG